MGASKPEEYGDYYAWGETETKEEYTEENCETWKEDIDDIAGTSSDYRYTYWYLRYFGLSVRPVSEF